MKFLLVIFCACLSITALMPEQSPDMLLVKGGTFYMGSNTEQPDEKPVHEVTLRDFYIGKKEVTVAEWKIFAQAVKKAMPEKPNWTLEDNFPMVYVGWTDAIEYCNWMSAKDKLTPCYKITKAANSYQVTCNFLANGYRLPTEAEWEFAARGGTHSRSFVYSGSNDINQVAYYGYNSDNKPHPVGQLKANEIGLFDMSGNAWEWVWDFYDNKYYTTSPSVNPTGPAKSLYRCLRGGSLLRNASSCRSTSRYFGIWLNFRGNSNGFRIARTSVTPK